MWMGPLFPCFLHFFDHPEVPIVSQSSAAQAGQVPSGASSVVFLKYLLIYHSFPHSFIPHSQHSLPALTVTPSPRLGCTFYLQRRKLRHRARE